MAQVAARAGQIAKELKKRKGETAARNGTEPGPSGKMTRQGSEGTLEGRPQLIGSPPPTMFGFRARSGVAAASEEAQGR